ATVAPAGRTTRRRRVVTRKSVSRVGPAAALAPFAPQMVVTCASAGTTTRIFARSARKPTLHSEQNKATVPTVALLHLGLATSCYGKSTRVDTTQRIRTQRKNPQPLSPRHRIGTQQPPRSCYEVPSTAGHGVCWSDYRRGAAAHRMFVRRIFRL